jgi:hypothetical protein
MSIPEEIQSDEVQVYYQVELDCLVFEHAELIPNLDGKDAHLHITLWAVCECGNLLAKTEATDYDRAMRSSGWSTVRCVSGAVLSQNRGGLHIDTRLPGEIQELCVER